MASSYMYSSQIHLRQRRPIVFVPESKLEPEPDYYSDWSNEYGHTTNGNSHCSRQSNGNMKINTNNDNNGTTTNVHGRATTANLQKHGPSDISIQYGKTAVVPKLGRTTGHVSDRLQSTTTTASSNHVSDTNTTDIPPSGYANHHHNRNNNNNRSNVTGDDNGDDATVPKTTPTDGTRVKGNCSRRESEHANSNDSHKHNHHVYTSNNDKPPRYKQAKDYHKPFYYYDRLPNGYVDVLGPFMDFRNGESRRLRSGNSRGASRDGDSLAPLHRRALGELDQIEE